MLGKWNTAARNMIQLRKHYLEIRQTGSISVHRTLIYRALPMLYRLVPDAEAFFAPKQKILVDLACRPDSSSDYEKGVGWHYYSAVNSYGIRIKKSGGYYKNGIHKLHKSPRTMLEEDFTMALTMYNAGFTEKSMEHLSRAIHMVADMSCPPHALGMTYYSPKKCVHQAFEDLARAMYPDSVPEQEISSEQLKLFDDRTSFEAALNAAVEEQICERKEIIKAPVELIIRRLHAAEINVCALLYRFYCDKELSAEEAHYIAEGNEIRLNGETYTAHISENGIAFRLDNTELSVQTAKASVCSLFRAAHRSSGAFTFSPINDRNSRVLSSDSLQLSDFSPHKRKIFFTISYHS